MHRSLRLMVCTAIAVLTASLPALARPTKVALTQIDGDKTGLWMAMEDALDDSSLDLVSTRRVMRLAERLELDEDLDDLAVMSLATELGLDAIIQGVFDPHTRKLRFTIFVNGKKGKPFNVQASDAGTDGFRKRVHAIMIAKLTAAMQVDDPAKGGNAASNDRRSKKARKADVADDAVQITDDDDDSPTKTKETKETKVAKDAKEPKEHSKPKEIKEAKEPKAKEIQDAKEPKDAKEHEDTEPVVEPDDAASQQAPHAPTAAATAPAAKPDDASEPAKGDAPPPAAKQVAEGDDESVPRARARFEPSQPATHGANRAAVRVDLGASVSAHDLRFETTAFDNAPRPYKNAPAPGARLEAELYPFATYNPNHWLAGIGVAGDFDQTVALTMRAPAAMSVPLKITERHYSFGLRYRLAFGHTPTSPTLTIGGGYGGRTFAVDRTGLMTGSSLDLPDVDYTLFDPGLAFRLPLGERFALTLGGRALLVTSTGQIQRADQYGKANIFGGAATAGLEAMFGNHIAFRVAAEATQLAFKFAGTGQLANNRDGNAATIDVRGATDRYLGGAATLAVLY